MPIVPTKIFRVFVSSTFADLVEERSALQTQVFPRLRALCEKHGSRFQPVDLRWGVSEEAGRDQRTMWICLEEINRCQLTTPRPNFLVLLGDRYGWRPLPAEIPVEDVRRMSATASFAASTHAFERLYPSIDRNAVPPVYCLRPRAADIEPEWAALEHQALAVFENAAREIELPLAERVRYGGSATEQEIVAGLFRDEVLPQAREHVHAFLRHIVDLPRDATSRKYLDWTGSAPDEEALARQNALKQRLRATLGGGVHEYLVHGAGVGALQHLREPEAGAQAFAASVGGAAASAPASAPNLCEEVYEALAGTIQQEAGTFEHSDPLDREIEAHRQFAAERSQLFIGRAGILRKIAGYLARDGSQPFAVTGASGSGKSAAMARALWEARNHHPAAALVARFIGATPESSSGMAVLASLARQISREYGQSAPPAYAEYPRIAALFREVLKLARPEKPLLLFLDALDQLPASDDARSLSWLPLDDVPAHVRIVVSVSSDSPSLYQALATKLTPDESARLDPMPAEEGQLLLDLWLQDARRQLQPHQRQALLDGFRSSGLPLYLRFAFEQGKLWRSFDGAPTVGADLLQIVRQMFARLSDAANHGEILVSRGLGYLTAAKDGLAEDEVLEVLSRDPAVMSDFRSRFPKSPPAGQIPMVVWSRLYYDLKPYLTERGGPGASVLTYFHRQMREAAASQYLDAEVEPERHRHLAEYFHSKPNRFGENGTVSYNARKLSELPYQQRKSGMWDELEATLCDLSFIESKCAAGLIYDLLADYAAALRSDLRERKARIGSFERFVRAQAHLLSAHPALTFQQALNAPDDSAPAQAAAALAVADRRPRLRWINKSQRASPCVLTIYGHTSYVNGCDVSSDASRIASASSDETIKIWNAATGKEELALRGRRISAESCHFARDGKRLVSGSRDGVLTMWDAVSGAELWSVKAHTRPIPTCKFDPEGRRVVSASWDGSVRVWDAENGAALLTLAGHAVDACSCQFSPDGSQIISAGGDGLLKVWSAGTGEELRSVKAHQHEIMSCRFSADGRWIFTSSQDTTVKRWDAATLEALTTYEGHGEGVWSLAVSPDSRRLVSGAKDGCIKLWNVETGAELASMREHANEVWDLAFFPDGSRFVSASWDSTVRVWDPQAAEESAAAPWGVVRSSRTGPALLWGYMIACCCSPDGRYYAGGGSDGSVRIWDAATGSAAGVFPIHRDFIFMCAFSPDTRWIASGAWDGMVKVFDLQERRESAAESMPALVVFCAFTRGGKQLVACCTGEIRVWDFDNGVLTHPVSWMAGEEPFVGCAVTHDGNTIIAGQQGGRFSFWDAAARQVSHTLEGTPGLITFTLSPDGRLISGTYEDGAVRVWDVPTRTQAAELRGHRERAVSCNFSPDSRRLVTGSWDRQIRLWDLQAPERAVVLAGHTDQLQDACFTPDGARILSSAVDGTVRLWDARSGAALGALLEPADSAAICVFSPDGRFVVTASHRHAMNVWSAQTGAFLRTLAGHREAVRACAFSPAGALLSASADGTLQLWNPERAEPLSILRGHRGPVQDCAFSADGAWIVSAGQDRAVRLWDAADGNPLAVLEGHDDWVQRVLVIANGRQIVSCSLDRTIRIWDVDAQRALHVLRGHETAIGAAAAAPNGVRFVTGGADGVLHLWDAPSGTLVATLSGHRAAIRACACAGVIVSASQDGTLRLWDPDTGHLLQSLEGHDGPVQACLFSPGGRRIVSASEDQFVKVWDATTGRQTAEYWIGSAALSLSWRSGTRRIAVGDALGRTHLLELEGVDA